MKKQQLTLIVFCIILFSSTLISTPHQTLPPWHWTIDYIHRLQNSGCFKDLNQMQEPYTRLDIGKVIIKTHKLQKENILQLSTTNQKLLYKLIREFRDEIKYINEKYDFNNEVLLGARIQSDINRFANDQVKYKGFYHTKIGAQLGDHFSLYNGIVFDQYLVDDPTYIGKQWRDVVGYTEQAYAHFVHSRFRIKFGRDFLRWGLGKSGSLIFSDQYRPLDHLLAELQLGPLKFSYLASELDKYILSQQFSDSLGGHIANRYIVAHRLDGVFLNGRLQIGISEFILYGGVNHYWEMLYLNPFIFYHGAQMNHKDQSNIAGTLDILFYPTRTWQLYTSLLIDDIQVEKTGPGDLEPNEIGWLIGTKWADPFQVSGMTVSGEYVRVANRTYKTPHPWETFMHRNRPLGHPLSNDFDYWQVGVTQWVGADWKFDLGYSQTRKGEGSLYTPWDEPWMNFTVEEGYSEPFPTGVVEKRSEILLQFRYFSSHHWGFEGDLSFLNRKNAAHIQDATKNETFWRLGIWFEGIADFRL